MEAPYHADAMTRVLVVGGTGLLGQYLRTEGSARGHEVVATTRDATRRGLDGSWRTADLLRLDSLPAVVKAAASDLVVNAAAMTDVDRCERAPDDARTVNTKAAGLLAQAAREIGAAFVHFSTDYVFDGLRDASETDEPRPVNQYGLSKLEGENLVREFHPKALVLRLSAVFGWNRISSKTNSVTWILSKLETGQEVPLFHDQRLTPTYAKTAAEVTFDLVAHKAAGTYHVASRDCVSRMEMGLLITSVFGIASPSLRPIATAERALLAKRPPAPCLLTRKVEETLKRPMPTFRECLEHMRSAR